MLEIILEMFIHTVKDAIKLIPFLFVAYIIMEYIEHKTNEKTKQVIQKSGKLGPFFGSLLGIVPQCGISAMAANLYAGRIITLGTLIAIFLSTSDEMLPILISEAAPIDVILKILAVKFIVGMIAGFVIDFILRKKNKNEKENKITEVCEHEHCHCEEGNILKSSIKHTANVFIYIFIILFILNIVIHTVGEDKLASLILNKPIIGPVIAGLIGLIPNCASSVILTELYLSNVINVSTMIAGLLVNAGVGVLILCKVNKNAKENAKVVGLLYAIGVIAGILLEVIGIRF